MIRHLAFTLFILHFALFTPGQARDWIHWRGPEQNGVSLEKNLPDSFDLKAGPEGNLVWQQKFGGRSAPLVLDGKLLIIQATGEGLHEGEQIVCFDEKTGKKLWNHRVNVFHTSIVSSRLGWTTLTADPETKNVYAHTTAGLLLCLNPEGKLVWSRSLTEEYGRISGYGGRIVTPIFDSGLVIVGMVNASWGDQGRGACRFAAFDGKTGDLVWWGDTAPNQIRGTYYSSPIVGVIGGQRLLISGGADGYLHAFKVRTGERVWSYRFAVGVINGSPIVDGNLVYCHHGEENPEGGPIGRVICVDASKIDPRTKQPKLVWEYKRGKRFGLASAALYQDHLYVPDDSGELFCFNAKNGKPLWTFRFGSEVRGAPLIADGRIYVFDVKGRICIIPLGKDLDEAPDELEMFEYKFRGPGGTLNETNGTVVAVNNRVYFMTSTDLYCLGVPDARDECGKYEEMPEEAKFDPAAKPAAIRLVPADVTGKANEKLEFQVLPVDANGRVLKSDLKPELSLPLPPKAPTGAQPPALNGKVEGHTVVLGPLPSQQGYVDAVGGDLKARARVRVPGSLPYTQNFDKIPEGAAPGGWINAQARFVIKKLPDGNVVLAKVNTNPSPPISKANAYITLPGAANYTIQADLMGTEVRNRIPDLGLVNSRYSFTLSGVPNLNTGKRQVRLGSWEDRPRVNINTDFDWQPGVWYTAKLVVEPKGEKVLVRGKVWKKGETEPEKWTVEFEDPAGNREGSAALYGYISDPLITPANPGAEAFYDNITITPNK